MTTRHEELAQSCDQAGLPGLAIALRHEQGAQEFVFAQDDQFVTPALMSADMMVVRHKAGRPVSDTGDRLRQKLGLEIERQELLLAGNPRIINVCGELAIRRAATMTNSIRQMIRRIETSDGQMELRILPFDLTRVRPAISVTPFDRPLELCGSLDGATTVTLAGDAYQMQAWTDLNVHEQHLDTVHDVLERVAWSPEVSLGYLRQL